MRSTFARIATRSALAFAIPSAALVLTPACSENTPAVPRVILDSAIRPGNLQDGFLNLLRKNKIPVTMFLVKGVKLQGIVTWFDNFSILLRRDGQSQLVYKHAISTIMPGQSLDPAQFVNQSGGRKRHRRRADELRDEAVRRTIVNFHWRTDLLDRAVVDDRRDRFTPARRDPAQPRVGTGRHRRHGREQRAGRPEHDQFLGVQPRRRVGR